LEKRNKFMKNPFVQYKRNVTSQWGEDGIIEEIFKRIGEKNKYCVEFGAGNGTELSNVWNLISRKKWNAILIEPNPVSFKMWQEIARPYGKTITLINAFVTLEKDQTLDDVLLKHGAPRDIDLLSIDIDSNDYHIFKSIEKIKPRLILLEHNPTIPAHVELFQKYNEETPFGSSLAANTKLAHEKGYKLVAATVTNGFYVRADEFSKLGIDEPQINDLFDDTAVAYVLSAYNGTLYLHSSQEAPSYTKLFNSHNVALTSHSIHTIVTGAGHNHSGFSETLAKDAKPIKILLDGKKNTTGIIRYMFAIASLTKTLWQKNKKQH